MNYEKQIKPIIENMLIEITSKKTLSEKEQQKILCQEQLLKKLLSKIEKTIEFEKNTEFIKGQIGF